MASEAPTSRRDSVHRHGVPRGLLGALGIVTVGALGTGAFDLAADPPDGGAWILGLLALMASACGAALLFIRAVRASVRVTDEGLMVVNPARTHRIDWSAIESFSLGASPMLPCVAYVELRDGGWLRIYGIQGARGWIRTSIEGAEAEIQSLNLELHARTTSGGSNPRRNGLDA